MRLKVLLFQFQDVIALLDEVVIGLAPARHYPANVSMVLHDAAEIPEEHIELGLVQYGLPLRARFSLVSVAAHSVLHVVEAHPPRPRIRQTSVQARGRHLTDDFVMRAIASEHDEACRKRFMDKGLAILAKG